MEEENRVVTHLQQQAAESGPSSAVSSHLELEEDIYQGARRSKRPLDIRKSHLDVRKEEYAEGKNLISLQEERLHKLVQCIGKCDVFCSEISLQFRHEHFEGFLEVKFKECDNVV